MLPTNLEVLFDNCLAADHPFLGSTFLRVFCPCIFQGSEDPHIKWLEFVSRFRGKAIKNDRGTGSVAKLLHFGGFVQCVTVNDKQNGSTAFVATLCERDEDLSKPLSENFIVCPALV